MATLTLKIRWIVDYLSVGFLMKGKTCNAMTHCDDRDIQMNIPQKPDVFETHISTFGVKGCNTQTHYF